MSLLFSTGAIAGSAAKGAPGMVLLTPTSIAHSGTSASIGANGQVTFTAVTSLSLNGVFSADFDNYVLSIRHVGSDTIRDVRIQMRTSGSNNNTSTYTSQLLSASSTTVGAFRQTNELLGRIFYTDPTQRSGTELHLYGPFLAQPTAWRGSTSVGTSNAYIVYHAGTHSVSSSFDGLTITPDGGSNFTGALQVYGVRS